MPLLRLHLSTGIPGEYPDICILCGSPACTRVERTFTMHTSLEGTQFYTCPVPACLGCARAVSKESLFKWLTVLGSVGLLALSIYALCMEMGGLGLACLAALSVLVIAFWRFSSRCNIPCLELTQQFALLKVRSAAFVEAYRAHMGHGGENEPLLDMVQRMLAEGSKRPQIVAALQARGESAVVLENFLGGRRAANRRVGMQRIGYGGLVFAGGIAATVLAPNTIFVGAIVLGFAYFCAGVVQLLTGTGNRL